MTRFACRDAMRGAATSDAVQAGGNCSTAQNPSNRVHRFSKTNAVGKAPAFGSASQVFGISRHNEEGRASHTTVQTRLTRSMKAAGIKPGWTPSDQSDATPRSSVSASYRNRWFVCAAGADGSPSLPASVTFVAASTGLASIKAGVRAPAMIAKSSSVIRPAILTP